MINLLLIHAGLIPHYRIPIYNYLSTYLKDLGYMLLIVSNDIQNYQQDDIHFQYKKVSLSVLKIIKLIKKEKIDVIIDYMELKHLYLFPTYIIAKFVLHKKIIYWGQGCDLLDRKSKIKNFAYTIELAMSDAIVLYAEHLKKYVSKNFNNKIFISNNTLIFNYQGLKKGLTKDDILSEYGIKTKKNIICIGRMQKRKKINHLFQAFISMNQPDIGLILVGPDMENILDKIDGNNNIYKLGPIYGDKMFDLLSSAEVYCLPGAVGLSIVDAFYCGLPFVTEEGDESAEIMYLKDGVNGFIVPKDNIEELSRKLLLLLDNDQLRNKFSEAAREEIRVNGSIDRFCEGFREALLFVK